MKIVQQPLTAVIAAALAFFQCVDLSCASEPVDTTSVKLRAGRFAVGISAQGMAGDLEGSDGKVVPGAVGAAEVRYGTNRWALSQPKPITGLGDTATVEYDLPGKPAIQVSIQYRLQSEGKAVVLAREVAVRADSAVAGGLDRLRAELAGKAAHQHVASATRWHGGQAGHKAGGLQFPGATTPNITRAFPSRWSHIKTPMHAA